VGGSEGVREREWQSLEPINQSTLSDSGRNGASPRDLPGFAQRLHKYGVYTFLVFTPG